MPYFIKNSLNKPDTVNLVLNDKSLSLIKIKNLVILIVMKLRVNLRNFDVFAEKTWDSSDFAIANQNIRYIVINCLKIFPPSLNASFLSVTNSLKVDQKNTVP